ncbi:hypothetical protein K1719_002796 [Acacia pycnantha]|nr:hypothetical protein K1719_002796 [Acacia pycnantha]
MKFNVFNVKAWSGGARAGVLEIGSCPNHIETPVLLLSTRKGLPHFIFPDLLSSLPSPDCRLLQVSPFHFLEGLPTRNISKIGGAPSNAHTKLGASFETPCGRLLIKPKDYMEMISHMGPNTWVALADEVPAWVTDKRNKASVDRTVRWLDDCLALNLAGGCAFGTIVGGYWIGGFGLGESIDERPPLPTAIMDILPDDKPRMVSGLGLPEEVLQGISTGIDLLDSTNHYNMQLRQIVSDSTKINLRATVYRKDLSPIVANCTCYTCKNHTKAYINHLLNVHEMLAQILLEIHNTHHSLMFFRLIRETIKDGSFEQFRQTFIESRRDHLEGEAVPA